MPAVSREVTSKNKRRRERRSAASVRRTTSRRPRSSLRRTIPAGSPARRCLSQEVFVESPFDGYDLIYELENEGSPDRQTRRTDAQRKVRFRVVLTMGV